MKNKIRVVILTALGVIGAHLVLLNYSKEMKVVAAILDIPTVLLLFRYWYSKKESNNKNRVLSVTISILLTLIITIGGQLLSGNKIGLTPIFCFASFLTPFGLYPIIDKTLLLLSRQAKSEFVISKKDRRILMVIIGITGLVFWVLFFPGIFTYDMASQNELLSKGVITSHWSVLYGMYLKFFLDDIGGFIHSYTLGFAIAMLIQALFCNYVLYKLLVFIAEKSKNKIIYYGSLCFFVFNPFLAVLPFTAAQDSVATCCLALLLMTIYSAIEDRDYFCQKKRLIGFIAAAFIFAAFRNNAIYCILASVPFFLVLKRKNGYLLAGLAIASFGLYKIYTGPIFTFLGVQKTTTFKEILSVPSQQLAKSLIENPTSFKDEDMEWMSNFYDLNDKYYLYEHYPEIADYTKDNLQNDFTKEHLGDYLGLWARIGARNPKKYLEAFLLNSFGFWMPYKDYSNDERINLGYMNYPGFIALSENVAEVTGRNLKPIKRVLGNTIPTRALDSIIFHNNWYYIPIVSTVSSLGIYFVVLMVATVILIGRRRLDYIAAISVPLLYELTLFLAPVAVYRYAYPVAYSVPIVLMLIQKALCAGRNDTLEKKKSKKKRSAKTITRNIN